MRIKAGSFIFVLMTLLFILILACSSGQDTIQILVVTGGHDFESQDFKNLFASMSNVITQYRTQPEANHSFSQSDFEDFDVLVFYDMIKTLEEEEKAAYIRLLKQGQNMLFLHHSLCSYQEWPDFEQILGGKYLLKDEVLEGQTTPASTYKHDVDMAVKIVDSSHPVTKGLTQFDLFDEVYGGYRVQPGVKVLLKTDHPESTEEIAWTHRYKNSQVIYIQPGHGPQAYQNENYRQLIQQAIQYLANE